MLCAVIASRRAKLITIALKIRPRVPRLQKCNNSHSRLATIFLSRNKMRFFCISRSLTACNIETCLNLQSRSCSVSRSSETLRTGLLRINYTNMYDIQDVKLKRHLERYVRFWHLSPDIARRSNYASWDKFTLLPYYSLIRDPGVFIKMKFQHRC